MPTALIVDDDVESAAQQAEVLRGKGFDIEMSQSVGNARKTLLKKLPEVAILSESLGSTSMLDLVEELDVSSVAEIIVTSDKPSLEAATRAMRLGVSDYLEKPVDLERLARDIDELRIDLDCEPGSGTSDKSGKEKILGESVAIRRLLRRIRKVAPTDVSVFIIGESGVGKELVANTIHDLSHRSHCELIAINCGAIPKDLIESELFGHKKGSFTGATADHRGYFQVAAGGTLLLDEITEMDIGLQAKLLRVLEVDAIWPVGGEKPVAIDTRVIAATNQEPDAAIREGRLREDLYYRLTQFPIRVPPLRERGDDVLLLARHFLEMQNAESGIEKSISDEALDAIRNRDWPGNVRELRNTIIHAHLSAGETIGTDDLPEPISSETSASGEYVQVSVGTPIDEVERHHILATLKHFAGDKKRAAKALGISLKTLYNRLKEYGEHGS